MKVCIFLYQTFFFLRTLICQLNRPLKEVWDEKKRVSNTVCYNTLTVGYTVSTKQTDCFGGGSQHGVAGGDNFNDSGLLMLARLKKTGLMFMERRVAKLC